MLCILQVRCWGRHPHDLVGTCSVRDCTPHLFLVLASPGLKVDLLSHVSQYSHGSVLIQKLTQAMNRCMTCNINSDLNAAVSALLKGGSNYYHFRSFVANPNNMESYFFSHLNRPSQTEPKGKKNKKHEAPRVERYGQDLPAVYFTNHTDAAAWRPFAYPIAVHAAQAG
jgi:hypothetical protein